MKYKLKIICYTPKGKAKKCSKGFGMQYFSSMKKPIKTALVSDSEFYYIYEYEKEKDMLKLINIKIPKAEKNIRAFYITLIHLKERANSLAKKGAWKVEKAKRWIMKQLRKKVKNPKEYDDFVDAMDLSDKDYMMEFLSKPLFEWFIMEEKK